MDRCSTYGVAMNNSIGDIPAMEAFEGQVMRWAERKTRFTVKFASGEAKQPFILATARGGVKTLRV